MKQLHISTYFLHDYREPLLYILRESKEVVNPSNVDEIRAILSKFHLKYHRTACLILPEYNLGGLEYRIEDKNVKKAEWDP